MSNTVLGPAGGHGGQEFTDYIIPIGARLKEIHLFAAQFVDAIQFVYTDAQGETVTMPRIGGLGGQAYVFSLDDDEYLTGISGHSDWYVDNLRFHTNKRISNFYGDYSNSSEFHFEADSGSEIVGLFGRVDWYIDAIGVITRERPLASPAENSQAKPAQAEPPATNSQTEPAPKNSQTKSNKVKPASVSRKPRPTDLQKVEGIGPKISGILIENGILDLQDLAETKVERLQEILDAAGRRYALANPTTWPEQAALGAKGDWEAMVELKEGRRV